MTVTKKNKIMKYIMNEYVADVNSQLYYNLKN